MNETADERSVIERLRPVLGDVKDVASYVWQRGWAEGGAGNLSIDVTESLSGGADGQAEDVPPTGSVPLTATPIPSAALDGRRLLVTAAGSRFRDIAREPESGMMLLDLDFAAGGCRPAPGLGPDDARPTSELASHLGIHASLRESGSTHRVALHTHATHVIALTHCSALAEEDGLNAALWAIHPELKVVLPEGVGLAPYELPGSTALGEGTARAVARHRVVVWEKHGCIAVADDVNQAFDLIEIVDKAAQLYLLCRGAGFAPRGLTEAQLRDLARLCVGERGSPDEQEGRG